MVLICCVKVAGDEHLDMLGGPEWGQREATPPRDAPLPSFGFTQEQVACVCEVSLFVCGNPFCFLRFFFVLLLVINNDKPQIIFFKRKGTNR